MVLAHIRFGFIGIVLSSVMLRASYSAINVEYVCLNGYSSKILDYTFNIRLSVSDDLSGKWENNTLNSVVKLFSETSEEFLDVVFGKTRIRSKQENKYEMKRTDVEILNTINKYLNTNIESFVTNLDIKFDSGEYSACLYSLYKHAEYKTNISMVEEEFPFKRISKYRFMDNVFLGIENSIYENILLDLDYHKSEKPISVLANKFKA